MRKSGLILPFLIFSFHFSIAQKADEKVEYYLGQFSYYEYMDWDSALMYLDSATIQGENVKDDFTHGLIDLHKGWYYQDISAYDTSKSFFFSSLEYFKSANAYQKVADVYGNLGNAFLDVGDLKNSLDYQLKSLETNEAILMMSADEDTREMAIRGRAYAWSNISSIYKILDQYTKSLDYEYKALEYELEKGDDSVGMGISFISIGTTYESLGIKDSALYYTNLAHGIFKRHFFSNGLISSLLTLYRFSEADGKPNLDLLTEAYQVAAEFQDKKSELTVLGYLVAGDFGFSKDSLENMVNRGHYLIEEYDLANSQYGFFEDEAKYRASVGEYREAYASLLRYVDLYQKIKQNNELVDFKNAELRHEYQMQSMQDSLNFEKTLHEQKLSNEREVSRQKTIIVISSFGMVILIVFMVFLLRAFRVKKKTNQQLSEKNFMIERQKEIVEEKNTEITASINYAKRLQEAILPPLKSINSAFDDSFVYYEPKDVVSGDFYWFEKSNNLVFLAAADCTGHGVPGAMVSVVCFNALNRSVKEFNLHDPADILNKTRELIIETFQKSGENVKDGMDINLCAFDHKNKKVYYAGANNPLWIVRNNKHIPVEQLAQVATVEGEEFSLIELKADKQPVGLYEGMSDFRQIEIQIFEDDRFYLFTDGFADQFGGTKGKKLKYRNFKQLILDHFNQPMPSQGDNLKKFMDDWMKDFDQIDDICVIGVKV
ncbi:SpoIIE family protein phosphatase [Paracrocinitomix mangrovi]|uniref:SpoIIE family protein phosphatase n=1 Tax=Paracrocinitomix mangrovi TaxID=2862509 RepID=UPI001C8E4EF9|nr:SpoIIE family protein phosphatase [Paracrocinitomix mangrovi]UKN01904.1 SpoIIE family protein phosphatase [Paracrocinitomix mangrovi]